ncbi:hypothetical protein AK88_05223 [Plasmodium fragile]|uniref:AP2/ERF domain-containing protein n=1 Tax=Plasmodium fragile TaxID=5857 RepID=A0A0D9QDV4_PLAFR|nr:uncharacterized protein AK88_05223 [Plasmodium fragile]KJP85139.1 hypothetical protein AK88_05223 [Plasmodium fragile]
MDSLEMNLLIENYIDEEKVCHNFPFRKFKLLLYAYKNYHQSVNLRKKDLANGENDGRCRGSDSKNGFDGANEEELSVNLSFPSNISGNGQCKGEECLGVPDVSNPTTTPTHTEKVSHTNVISACASGGEANLATNHTNHTNHTNDTNDDQVMEKVPGQGKNPVEKIHKKINFEHRTESLFLPKQKEVAEHQQTVEDYSEEDMLKLIYYFLHKYMFSRDRKKKNKLRGKNSLMLMLEREQDGQTNTMVGSKGVKKSAVNGALSGASRGRNKNGQGAQEGVKKEVKGGDTHEGEKGVADEVKMELVNEAEKEVRDKMAEGEANVEAIGGGIELKVAGDGAEVEGAAASEHVEGAAEGEDPLGTKPKETDKTEQPHEGVSEMNSCESGKANPHGEAHEENGKACVGSENHQAVVSHAGEEAQGDAAAEATAGEDAEEEEKRLELIINTFMNRKQIFFSMNDIFYPFTNRHLNMSRKKQQNKKLSKNISFERSNNRFSKILGHVDLLDPRDSAPSRRYLKSKVIYGKFKKGLNLLLKHEKKKKRKYRRHGTSGKVDDVLSVPPIGEGVEGSHNIVGGNIGHANVSACGDALARTVVKAAGRKKGNKGAAHTANENEEYFSVTCGTRENDANCLIKSVKEKTGRGRNVGEKKGVKMNNVPVSVNPSEACSNTIQMQEGQHGVPLQMGDPRFNLHAMGFVDTVRAIRGGEHQARPIPRKHTSHGRGKQKDSGSTHDGFFSSAGHMKGYSMINVVDPAVATYYVGGEVGGQVGGQVSGQVGGQMSGLMNTPIRYDHPVCNPPGAGTPVNTPNKGSSKKEKTGGRKNVQKKYTISKEAPFYNASPGATSFVSIAGGGGLYPYGNIDSSSNVDKPSGVMPPHGPASSNTNVYIMNKTEQQRYAQEAHTINPYIKNDVMNKMDHAKNRFTFKGTNDHLQTSGPVGVDMNHQGNGGFLGGRQSGEHNFNGSEVQAEEFKKEYCNQLSGGAPRSRVKKNVKGGKKANSVKGGVHSGGNKRKGGANQMGRDAKMGPHEDGCEGRYNDMAMGEQNGGDNDEGGGDPGGGNTSVGQCYDENKSNYENRRGGDDDNNHDGSTPCGGGGGAGMGSSYYVGNNNSGGRRGSVGSESRYKGKQQGQQEERHAGGIGGVGGVGSGPMGVVGYGLGSTAEDAKRGETLLHTSLNLQVLDGQTRTDDTVGEVMVNAGTNVRCTIVGNVTCIGNVVTSPSSNAVNVNVKDLHGDLSRGKAYSDVSGLGKGTIITKKKQNQNGTYKEGHFVPVNDRMKEQVGSNNVQGSCELNISFASMSEGRSRVGTGNVLFNTPRNEDISCGNGVGGGMSVNDAGEAKKITSLQVKGDHTFPLWGDTRKTQWCEQMQEMEKMNREDVKDESGVCTKEVTEKGVFSKHSFSSGGSIEGGENKVTINGGGIAKMVSEDASTSGCSSVMHMRQVAEAGLNVKGANKLNYCSEGMYLDGVNLSTATSLEVHKGEEETEGVCGGGYLNHAMSTHVRMTEDQEIGPLGDSPSMSEAGGNFKLIHQSRPPDHHDGVCDLGKLNSTADNGGSAMNDLNLLLRTSHSTGNYYANESSPVEIKKDNAQGYVEERGAAHGGDAHGGSGVGMGIGHGSSENRLPPVIVQQSGMKRKAPSLSQTLQGSKKGKGGLLAMGVRGANSRSSRGKSDGKNEGQGLMESFSHSCTSSRVQSHSMSPLANWRGNPLTPSHLHNQAQQHFSIANDGYMVGRNTVSMTPNMMASVAEPVSPIKGGKALREVVLPPTTTVELSDQVEVNQDKKSNTQVASKWSPISNSHFTFEVNDEYEQWGLVGKNFEQDACTEKAHGMEKATSSTLGKGLLLRSEMGHLYGHGGRTVSDAKVHSIRSVSYAMNGESDGRRMNAGGVLLHRGLEDGTNICNSRVSNSGSSGCGESRSYSVLNNLKEREKNAQGGMQECTKVRALPTEGKQFILGSHDICGGGSGSNGGGSHMGVVGRISGDWGKFRPYGKEPSGSRVVAKARAGVQNFQSGNVDEGRGEYHMDHFGMATPGKFSSSKDLQEENLEGVELPSEASMYTHPQTQRDMYTNKVVNEISNENSSSVLKNSSVGVDPILANGLGDNSNLVSSMNSVAGKSPMEKSFVGTSLVGCTPLDDLQRGVTNGASRNVLCMWDKGTMGPPNVPMKDVKRTNRMELADKQSSNSATIKDEENGVKLRITKKKKRKTKDALVQEDPREVKEQAVSDKAMDDEMPLCDMGEENPNDEAKSKPKRSRRSRVGKDGEDQVVTGAYDENGEKISGVWYDTNRRLWRVMYMENDKRKTRGFSPRIYGFNLARELAVKLKYEMMEKNKK